jgi:hypothetical protein
MLNHTVMENTWVKHSPIIINYSTHKENLNALDLECVLLVNCTHTGVLHPANPTNPMEPVLETHAQYISIKEL